MLKRPKEYLIYILLGIICVFLVHRLVRIISSTFFTCQFMTIAIVIAISIAIVRTQKVGAMSTKSPLTISSRFTMGLERKY